MVTPAASSVATLSGDSALRVLFIGGTGVISAAAARRAVDVGHRLTILSRGNESLRPAPEGAEVIRADIRDTAWVRAALGDRKFDVVVDFVAFTADHVAADIGLFAGRTSQYVFISSASAYQKPPPRGCRSGSRRPCGTRSGSIRGTRSPARIYWSGTSVWTLTHSSDFAKGLVGLLGLPQAVGDSFTITSDESLPWNEIYEIFARAAGAPPPRLVHIASDTIAAVAPDLGPSLLGDKSHSVGLRQQQGQGPGAGVHLHGSVRPRCPQGAQLVRREPGPAGGRPAAERNLRSADRSGKNPMNDHPRIGGQAPCTIALSETAAPWSRHTRPEPGAQHPPADRQPRRGSCPAHTRRDRTPQ